MTRTIIIGDVHGCLHELEALLDKVNFKPGKDMLYFLGDIINRGPYSKEVFLKIRQLKAKSVIGNHEFHLLRCTKAGKNHKIIKRIRQEFGSEYENLIKDISLWPFYLETRDFLLVHGGLVPGVSLESTDPYLLTSIRTWDGQGVDINSPENPPWFEFYNDFKLVVFGHWAAMNGVVRDNAIGLDTGCVYGKKLTALILPGKEFVSVPAEKEYFSVDE